MNVLFGPTHLCHVNHAFDTWLEFNEGTIIGDVSNAAGKTDLQWILGFHTFPRISFQLFHTETNTLGLAVEADNLHINRLTNLQCFRRMIDTSPSDISYVQQPINATKVNERTVIGDVLHHTIEYLSFLEPCDQFSSLFGTTFFQNSSPRHNNIAA